jgi:hypothetical protein
VGGTDKECVRDGFLGLGHCGRGCHHPHLHCVIPGGGLSPDGAAWISCRPNFFLPVAVLSCLFRRLFLTHLQRAFEAGQLRFAGTLEHLSDSAQWDTYLQPARDADWVVYAKAPFAGPEQVLDYVGRYTHRVAISNNRILDIADGQVTFRWKDYRDDGAPQPMTLPAEEFIRRFLLHVLPDAFQRIRFYGFMANRFRKQKLATCRQLLGMPAPEPADPEPSDYRDCYEQLTGSSLRLCPLCRQGTMRKIRLLTACPAIQDSS